jgi:hypothetical protein
VLYLKISRRHVSGASKRIFATIKSTIKIVNKNVDIWNNLLSGTRGQNISEPNNLKVVWEQENQRA